MKTERANELEKRNEFHVKIGELKIARSPDILKATLGSCVGIAFLWKQKNRFGLAHCLLPEAPSPTYQIGARFVSQAIPSLLYMMKLKPADYAQLEVFLAGGGNMMDQLARSNPIHVGIQNAESAKKILNQLGIGITKTSLGGERAHQIVVDCSTGHVEMKTIEEDEI